MSLDETDGFPKRNKNGGKSHQQSHARDEDGGLIHVCFENLQQEWEKVLVRKYG